jgi:two-component system, chemotaxis family, CheB/CheR fusion protein
MSDNDPESPESAAFEALLDHIRLARRFDFTGYKRSSLSRRIRKRMSDIGVETYGEYLERLEANPEEFKSLFDTILVNVTSFFRDRPAWDYLADEVLTRIVSGKQPRDPIRVWSAGCASGEETYSLAMILCEALGPEQFQARVKIYGTDADEDALVKARAATYTERELAGVDEQLRERYFEANGERHTFRNDFRRQVIFGRHDLVQDAPISRLDLLVCRNTLMYFNAETQAMILDRFGFALADRGFMMLGKAETLLANSMLFVPVEVRLRIFAKSPDARRTRLMALPHGASLDIGNSADLRSLAFDRVMSPLLVLDDTGRVVEINSAARDVLGLRPNDVGMVIQDLEISFRPVELRSAIREAIAERRTIVRKSITWTVGNEERAYDVVVSPLIDDNGLVGGTSVVFADVTAIKRLEQELEQSSRDLEAAYEELQSTNEELETTNEELQSTIEELETTNEELQSSNEELETTNEELQSTNDELSAANVALEVRGAELDRVNVYLEGILTGLRRGVIVVDTVRRVRLWSRWSEDLWGVRADEADGRLLTDLDIGLPVDELDDAIETCLHDSSSLEERLVDATNRRGQRMRCRVVCTSLMIGNVVDGVILLVEDAAD